MKATFNAPTYYGNLAESLGKDDFDSPVVLVHVDDEVQGVRLRLGDGDAAPCIVIERQHGRWGLWLAPDGEDDYCGYIYMNDDKTTFVISENHEPRIEWRDHIPPLVATTAEGLVASIEQAGQRMNNAIADLAD